MLTSCKHPTMQAILVDCQKCRSNLKVPWKILFLFWHFLIFNNNNNKKRNFYWHVNIRVYRKITKHIVYENVRLQKFANTLNWYLYIQLGQCPILYIYIFFLLLLLLKVTQIYRALQSCKYWHLTLSYIFINSEACQWLPSKYSSMTLRM